MNNNLGRYQRPYFALQNSHGQAKEFLRKLYKIWARALKKFRQSITYIWKK